MIFNFNYNATNAFFFQVMKTKEIIGTVSDDNLVLSGNDFTSTAKDEEFLTKNMIKEELNEFIEINDEPLIIDSKCDLKKKCDKKIKKNQKQKPILMKFIKTGSSQLHSEMKEFLTIKKDVAKVDATSVPKRNNRKRKRKQSFSEIKLKYKNKISDGNNVSHKNHRRRSQRLRSGKGSVKNVGDV